MEVEPGSPSAGGEQEEQQGAVHLALSNLPALTALLQAIKISAKQVRVKQQQQHSAVAAAAAGSHQPAALRAVPAARLHPPLRSW